MITINHLEVKKIILEIRVSLEHLVILDHLFHLVGQGTIVMLVALVDLEHVSKIVSSPTVEIC